MLKNSIDCHILSFDHSTPARKSINMKNIHFQGVRLETTWQQILSIELIATNITMITY